MLTDSHCHLDTYADDLPAVLTRAQAAGVSTLLAIGIGEGPATMHQALTLARHHTTPGLRILASAGIHPQEAHQATPENLAKLRTLLEDPLTVAVGEIGLDYYHLENPDIPTQQTAFIAQLHLAAAARKPILIHLRTSELATPAARQKFGPADAWQDLFALLAEHWTPHRIPGVMHCFSGGVTEAGRALAANFYISFAGNLTYPRSQGIRDAAAMVPTSRLLVETDAPFLAPIPHRGERNEPALLTHTATFLAGLRGLTPADLATQTTANFNRLFPHS